MADSPVQLFVGRMFRNFLWFATSIGAIVMAAGTVQVLRGRASLGWPSVRGEIVDAFVRTDTATHGGGAKKRRIVQYLPDVLYRFSVNGNTYRNSHLTYKDSGSRARVDAQRVVDRYPVGSTVTVYYEPDNPAVSVLEPGASGGTYVTPVIGLVIMLLIGPFALQMTRALRESVEEAELESTRT